MGDYITFEELSYPGEWQNRQIENILVDDNILLFKDGYISIDEITKVKRSNAAAQYSGKSLMTFGLSYLLYGIIIELATDNGGLDTTNISVGTGAMSTGYILNRTFGKKIYWMGKTSRLRIVDLRFSID